ncbi:pur operon repressor [Anoxybacter fermentans]|uniref:Pur operon repressor n=1 Tax=Anoxybacter fermentans TaxID=1323375 RepID=A0A3S9T1N6_9FIRM|nr:pur operon repressor [Anoxybacter fermentans]AZR74526.1 pur operon repressor [Anoxybacter fermentans]
MRRSERIAVITRILTDNPHQLFPLKYFTEKLNSAKSSISEDLTIIKEVFQNQKLGLIETLAGAAGGVRYIPLYSRDEIENFLKDLCTRLSDPERVLPGNFLYMTDLIFTPEVVNKIGGIFATCFADKKPDYIITMETKGIPIALMTARAFNVPLVTIRRSSRVTEGSVVSINYVTGSSKKIETMSLPRKALPVNSKVIIIDDFMKAGGTARGMMELMQEFKAEVLGLGVLVTTAKPEKKLVEDYISLLVLEDVNNDTNSVVIRPGDWIYKSTEADS